MVTSGQIKMARAALNWSISDLSSECAVSVRTLSRAESEEGFKNITAANLKLIVTTLERAGIEFIGAPGEGPGVRYWKK